MRPFEYRNGALFCEELKVAEIVDKVGTPAYIYSRKAVLENFSKICGAFSEAHPLICFSVKSNSNLSILRLLNEVGAGFDVVSGGELYRTLEAGANPQRIVFAGVGKTEAEIRYGVENNIFMFNAESGAELGLIDKVARSMRKKVQVALRLNPDIDPRTHVKTTTGKKENKFGIDLVAAEEIVRESASGRFPGIKINGLHVHLGSPIYSTEPYVLALKKIIKFLPKCKTAGLSIEYINIGGGYCISYTGEPVIGPAEYARDILPLFKRTGASLIMEPGRFIVGNAGILATRALYTKETNYGKKFVICDAAMNDLIRPTLYDAFHRIWTVENGPPMPEVLTTKTKAARGFETVDVVGPVCETSDVFARNRALPAISGGELLAIFDAGAYGFTMSSNYNSRPRACEVLVEGKGFSIIRKREGYKDLVAHEI